MPTITIEGPPIPDLDTKRVLVRELTDAATKAYGLPHITVVIRENQPENVAVDGQLVVDRRRGGPGSVA